MPGLLSREVFLLDSEHPVPVPEIWLSKKADGPRIALIGGFTPRRCGIATFTADIHASLATGFPDASVDVYAMAPVANDIA
jgi:hypothetical protein